MKIKTFSRALPATQKSHDEVHEGHEEGNFSTNKLHALRAETTCSSLAFLVGKALLFVSVICLALPSVGAEVPPLVSEKEAIRKASEATWRALYTLPSSTDQEFQALLSACETFLANAHATLDQKSTLLELMRNRANQRHDWKRAATFQRRNIALPELPVGRRLQQQAVLAEILWRKLHRTEEAVALYRTILADPAFGEGPHRQEIESWLTLLTGPE